VAIDVDTIGHERTPIHRPRPSADHAAGRFPGRALVPRSQGYRRFLDLSFAQKAGALGWSGPDLYGVDESRPYARIDQAGLVIMLNGRMIVELNADAVILQTAGGTRQTYHRKRNQGDGGQVLIWDLKPDGT
jgi:hypothetical protein